MKAQGFENLCHIIENFLLQAPYLVWILIFLHDYMQVAAFTSFLSWFVDSELFDLKCKDGDDF